MPLQSYATTTDLGLYLRDVSTANNTTVWTALLDRASRFIDDQTGWFFYQLASAAYLVDGNNSTILIPNFPIVSVSLLEQAYYTGATFQTVTSTNYFLQPAPVTQGWPFTMIELTDIPNQGQAVKFWKGKQNVRITGVIGWPAIPSDIVHLTLKLAARWWAARDAGWKQVQGSPETGITTIPSLDLEDRYILNAYRKPRLF